MDNTELAKQEKMVLYTYIAYCIGFIFPLGTLAGFIIALMKKNEVTGTWMESHYKRLIKNTIIAFVLGVIGIILTFVGVGILIFVSGLWFLITTIMGFVRFNAKQPAYKGAQIAAEAA